MQLFDRVMSVNEYAVNFILYLCLNVKFGGYVFLAAWQWSSTSSHKRPWRNDHGVIHVTANLIRTVLSASDQ